MNFELDKKSLKMKDILNKEFIEIEICAISDAYPNRNGSVFTLESMKQALPSFANKPILGAWDNVQDDFKSHNGELQYDKELEELYYDYYSKPGCETPLGMIRESDKVEIVYDEDRKENWIVVHAVLWSRYAYNQIKKLLRKNGKSKISVEVEVESSHTDENGYEIFDKFNFTGLTILGTENGKPVEEGIENAHLTILELMGNQLFQQKQKCLAFAYSALDEYSKDNVETPEKGSNKFESGSITNESPKEEVVMDESNNNQEEGGSPKMNLTMRAKMDLLEASLNESLNPNKDCWVWVCDLDETFVYFETNEECYRATYQITEAEENNEVSVNLDEKERVVRSWATFSAEDNEAAEATAPEAEAFAEDGVCPECGKNPCECQSCGDGAKQEEAKQDDDDDAKDDDPEDDSDDNKEEESCGNKTEEGCGSAAEFAGASNPNEEPPAQQPTMTVEEGLSLATESISAPGIQTEAEGVGLANEGVQEVMGAHSAVIPEPTEDPTNANLETPDVIPVQPDDDAKEHIYSAEEYDALAQKYAELEEKYNTLNESVRNSEAERLSKFGAEFINSDTVVDEETKANYVAQVDEKCKAFELTSEEEVTKFAKGLMAMYYYENQAAKKEEKTEEFTLNLNKPAHSENIASNNKLKDAINKLNHAQ